MEELSILLFISGTAVATSLSLIIYILKNKISHKSQIIETKPKLSKSTSTSELQEETQNMELLTIPLIESPRTKKNSSSDSEFIETGRFQRLFGNSVLIGKGGFGEVYKVIHKVEQTTYAIKKVVLSLSEDEDVSEHRLYREVKTLTEVEHPNVVRFYTSWIEECFDCLEEEEEELEDSSEGTPPYPMHSSRGIVSGIDFEWEADEEAGFLADSSYSKHRNHNGNSKPLMRKINLFIQMAYCSNNSLKSFLDSRTEIDYSQNFKLFSQILSGIQYLHSKNIIHRDLKPSNIFMPSNDVIKIGDFGLARVYSGKYATSSYAGNTLGNSIAGLTGKIGSPFYVAPEQESGRNYNDKVDIYSLGVILVELFQSFKTLHERYKFFKTFLHRSVESQAEEFPKEIWDLVKVMVNLEADSRPNAKEIGNSINYNIWRKASEV